jgi:UDP-glucose 4-epimerase
VNVLILGGNGFIGSHIVDALLEAGFQVRIFARQSSQISINAEIFIGDFLDKAKLSEALIGIDAVIHCISTTVPATSALDPLNDVNTNLIGTIELLRLMHAQRIRRLIYLSSGGTVYGNPTRTPVHESTPLNPISNYGAVKVAIEKFIGVSQINQGILPTIVRPSNPYGERQGHKGVQGLISTVLHNYFKKLPTKIYGDGSVIRDYIYVKDVANLVTRMVDSEHCGVYNAGSGIGYSINQIISTIEQITGSAVKREYSPSRGFDVKEIVLDSSLAHKEFKWKPETSIDVGIKMQYEWLKEKYGRTNR